MLFKKAIEIVDLPSYKWWIFPSFFVNVYRAGYLPDPQGLVVVHPIPLSEIFARWGPCDFTADEFVIVDLGITKTLSRGSVKRDLGGVESGFCLRNKMM